MKNYFGKFGPGWIITGIALMLVYILLTTLSRSALWPGAVATSFFVGLIFIFGPFFFGFLGFTRFFAWMVSWGILVVLEGLLEQYVFNVGANGSESLGPVMLLFLPIFVIVGIADEIRYRIKSRKLKENGQQKIST